MKSADKKVSIGLLFLLIPFAAMAFMIITNANKITSTEYRFEIEGYDPRDLLRGHYMVFQYKWPNDTTQACNGGNCCACFEGEPESPSVTFLNCRDTKRPSCYASLKVEKFGDSYQPNSSLRQFYIPQSHASILEYKLARGENRFEVGIVPQSDGTGRLKTLYIDGKPMQEFLSDLNDSTRTGRP
jgi:GDYXXLXY protein